MYSENLVEQKRIIKYYAFIGDKKWLSSLGITLNPFNQLVLGWKSKSTELRLN